MTLHRWDQNGILRKVWIDGKRRYRKSDIERLAGTKLKSQHSKESKIEL
jgi:DNA-binding transcriptional MerR regulator